MSQDIVVTGHAAITICSLVRICHQQNGCRLLKVLYLHLLYEVSYNTTCQYCRSVAADSGAILQFFYHSLKAPFTAEIAVELPGSVSGMAGGPGCHMGHLPHSLHTVTWGLCMVSVVIQPTQNCLFTTGFSLNYQDFECYIQLSF